MKFDLRQKGVSDDLALDEILTAPVNGSGYNENYGLLGTNKATEEMKSRILKEIHLLASGQPSSYLDNLCRELSLDAATVRRRAREVRSNIVVILAQHLPLFFGQHFAIKIEQIPHFQIFCHCA